MTWPNLGLDTFFLSCRFRKMAIEFLRMIRRRSHCHLCNFSYSYFVLILKQEVVELELKDRRTTFWQSPMEPRYVSEKVKRNVEKVAKMKDLIQGLPSCSDPEICHDFTLKNLDSFFQVFDVLKVLCKSQLAA